MKPPVIHHWRWRSPRTILTCGARNGTINKFHAEAVTCKTCIKVAAIRGWDITPGKPRPTPGFVR